VSEVPSNRSSRRPSRLRVWPRLAITLVCVFALGAPLTAGADSQAETLVSPGLLDAAQTHPDSAFKVIVEGESGAAAAEVQSVTTVDTAVTRSFETIPAVAAMLTGDQIVTLAEGSDPLVITRDTQVAAADEPSPPETTPPQGTSEEPTISGAAEPGVTLTVTPGDHSSRWQRCASDLRETAVEADSPLGYWPLGERQEDAQVMGPGPDSSTSGFSLEGWVEIDSPQSDRTLISRWVSLDDAHMLGWDLGGGMTLYLDQDGNYGLSAGEEPSRVRTAVAPAIGEREHVVGTRDGSHLRLFRNGVQIGSAPLDGLLHSSSLNLTVASAVDDVAAYDQALSPSDVRGHHAGCVDISGADGPTYQPTADDLGSRLRAVTSDAASALTPLVTARPPVPASPPSILGTAEEAQTLSAANGSWDGTLPFEFGYQWRRCDVNGEACVDIAGAAEAGYTPTPADVGATIRLAVTVRGLGGEELAISEASTIVAAIPELHSAFKQHWPYVAGVASLLSSPEGQQLQPPTIAIVDSGIDADRADFGGRVVERVDLSSREANQPGDGNGHGTAVASVAAGQADGYTGAAPNARLVDVDVLDDQGVANVSDVIAAADWIYNNRERLNIRVANFSLHGTTVASLASDPLDKAVERLWLSGIVVVAAAGNYAVDGEESAVPFAPANDPFVLTVGATDTKGSYSMRDDVAAPWSAWGYTRDGFAKPEVSAPGRYIVAAVSANAKLAQERPERIVEPGYMQLSGTSLAAPVVSGIAANLLAAHPAWTPDQVKGALMLSAEPLSLAPSRSVGVGAVHAARAAAVETPPNPNLALNGFLVPDSTGGPTQVFDAASWSSAAQADPAWASVAWGSVAWGSAAWSSVAWGSVAWGSVAWGSVAWGSVAWGSVAWGSVAWGSSAANDVRPEGGYWTRRN
jgi:serine protease AprX